MLAADPVENTLPKGASCADVVNACAVLAEDYRQCSDSHKALSVWAVEHAQ